MNLFRIISNCTIVILFFALLIFVKIEYFYHLPYYLHFLIDLLSIFFTYLFVQPVLLQALKQHRKIAIYMVTIITFALSFLWNLEYIYLFNEEFNIELYFIPIILSALFFSMNIGFSIAAMAALSHILLNIFVHGFELKFVLTGSFLFITFGLVVIIITHVIKHRDKFLNKRDILVQESNSLVLGMNSAGKIDLCNRRMMDFLGLEDKEILNQYFWEVQKLIENNESLKIFNLLHDANNHDNEEFEIEIEEDKCYFIVDSYMLENDGFISGKMIVLRNITERKEMEHKLKELSITDELTRLYNRRYFETKFREEIIRSERYNHPLSLIMMDLDHFKNINDTHGHSVGDQVLKRVSSVIMETVRVTDICARLGGEELAVLLPETDGEETYKVANRILQSIRDLEIFIENNEVLRVTASIGVTTRTANFNMAEMIEETDKCVYTAKEKGRNQTCTAG
jgi:diguanylate cyclase (GGDEF)-like protein/PAS domain S-box-containing protein